MPQKTQYEPIIQILEQIRQELPHAGRVELLQEAARRLSEAVSKDPTWKHRYIHNVAVGNQPPSKELERAVQVLGAMIDGTPGQLANTVQVSVFAAPGDVKPGSLVQAKSRKCAYVGCGIWFIPPYDSSLYCCEEHKRLERNRRRREKRRLHRGR